MTGLPEVFDALTSHALSLGLFESVNGHEPKSAPQPGLTCALWLDSVRPVRTSGLNSTSVLITLSARVYTAADTEPADGIDPALLASVDTLCRAYCGDFTLNDANGNDVVRSVDIFGSAAGGSPGMICTFGYVPVGQSWYRTATITLPVIVNDLWDQGG